MEKQSTKDLWFASFLMLKGYTVSNYEILSANKIKGIFYFDINLEDWTKYKLEFSESDISKVKYFQEQLKDLIY